MSWHLSIRNRPAASILATIFVALLHPSYGRAATTITQSTCPVIIGQPGVYVLATDIGPCGPGVNGIEIVSSRVALFLAGHRITGTFVPRTCNKSIGIRIGVAATPVSQVAVVGNGTIRDFRVGLGAINSSRSLATALEVTADCPFDFVFRFGFSLGFEIAAPGSEWTLARNRVREPGPISIGIRLDPSTENNLLFGNDVNDSIVLFGSNNVVLQNTANDNDGGILLAVGSNNNRISGNTTNNNTFLGGIVVPAGSTGNKFTENTSLNNVPFDMQDDNPNCDSNVWEDNEFNSANQACIH